MTWYAFFRAVARLVAWRLVRLEVCGRGHVPRGGPFLLVVNHLSFLDPILVAVACPRRMHALAKSTQFASGRVYAWLLPRVNAIPARRYKVDPQVVRTVLRLLEAGEGVCIYPEGERSWDGAPQPLRRGTVRLLLKAGVPVVPCGISGSYEAKPRWSATRHRARVALRFGEPIVFGVHDTRAEREAAFDAAAARIVSSLARLSGTADAGAQGAERPVSRS